MKLSRWSVFATLALVMVVAVFVDFNPGSILPSGYANAAELRSSTGLAVHRA